MFKKVKKILGIGVVVQSILGIFMGLIFILDKLGKIDLEQLGILMSGSSSYGSYGYVDGDIVRNMEIVHKFVDEKNFTYGNPSSPLNDSTVGENGAYLSEGIIDCSAYVCYVLWVSGIKIGRQVSNWFADEKYLTNDNCKKYTWTKITNANDLRPGDILVRHGHVEFYREGNTTYSCGRRLIYKSRS